MWLDGIIEWAINHQRIIDESERLVGPNLRPEAWLSQFLYQLPDALREQLRMAGNQVAPDRARLLPPGQLAGRSYAGAPEDYLTANRSAHCFGAAVCRCGGASCQAALLCIAF